ncbi:MAG: beta-ketoacyl-ACP reductase [marine bacterium B5-7]|nr:MAG: beta-ketoacyl-ACP reductase [marine bacterium B5-7]
MQPDNKHILITGGAGGIGVPLVARLTEAGAKVTVASRRANTRTAGESVEHVELDLTRRDSIQALATRFAANVPDILINLAGVNAFGRFEAMSDEDLEAIIKVNLLAPMQLTRSLLPAMSRRGSGQIVNIGSVLGDIGMAHFVAYSASKAGLANFSEALRREVDEQGIVVTHVSPRAVDTPMNGSEIERFNMLTDATVDSAERVADIIFESIVNDRAHVTIGIAERFFVKVNALVPRVVDRSLKGNLKHAESVLENAINQEAHHV